MEKLAKIQRELKDYILEHFSYKDGVIYRDDRKNSNGSLDKCGYLIYKIKGVQIKAHRLVWFLNYREFPSQQIDHINRIKTDNRIENLRLADAFVQNRNKDFKPNKDTGVVGIYLDKSTKGLLARYTFRHKNKTYRFRTLENAIKTKKELLCTDL